MFTYGSTLNERSFRPFSNMEVQLREIQEQLQKERQRTEEERRLRELAEHRAEQQGHRAEQERHRAEQAEDKTRRTNFEELLETCHRVSQSMSVQTDKSLSTQGSTTSPKGKCCPTRMRPWEDFPAKRQSAFDQVYTTLHPPKNISPRLFSPLLHIEELGRTVPGRMIASEEDLKFFQHLMVETFVADVISALAANQKYIENWTLGHGVVFENHTNTLSDMAEDVQERLQILSSSKNRHRTPKPIHADQICVYKSEDDQMDLLFIIEYKAPHKLTKEILRAGLRVMDVPKDVINRPTIPTDPQEKFGYNADRLVAAAVTQTYSYMLESGVEYSCIVTGEALVFLRIKADDANTLYYHLAEPKEEASTGDGLGFKHPLTAIAQLLSFCVMALQSERRNELWRRMSTQRAQRWSEDWEKILQDVLPEERKLDPPSSVFTARTYPINKRSPYLLRRRDPLSLPSGCSPEDEPVRDEDDEGGDPSEGPEGPESINTPSKGGSTSRGERGNGRGSFQSSSSAGKQRQYCTQGCLLGLVLGSAIDNSCPNAPLHRRGKKRRTHLLNKQEFGAMVQRQLAMTLDRNCKDLKIQGSRGALFQITLASHGYTFVAKGTRDVFVPDLMHEGRMYDRLKSIQGKLIPVYLGNIDLDWPWLDFRVQIIHMLLMSWGGERIDKVKGERTFDMEIKQFERQISRMGVQHEDIRPPNMLWSQETERIMFIDLERATEISRIPLQELPGNRKRKRSLAATDELEIKGGRWRGENESVT